MIPKQVARLISKENIYLTLKCTFDLKTLLFDDVGKLETKERLEPI